MLGYHHQPHQQHHQQRRTNSERVETAPTTNNSSSSTPAATSTAAAAAAVNHDDDDDEQHSMITTVFARVAVVGAGAAGLQCAHSLLQQHGLDPSDVIVLEARDRVGGRIHTTTTTTTVNDDSISHHHSEETNTNDFSLVRDHGAAWVHGTGLPWLATPLDDLTARPEPNPVMELLRRETAMHAEEDDDDYADADADVYRRHLNPVAKAGNPWLRPRTVLHRPRQAEEQQHDAAPPLLQLYVGGRALNPQSSQDGDDDSIIETALQAHFERLRQVHRIGRQMFDQGQGLATVTTSLRDALDVVAATTTTDNKNNSANNKSKERLRSQSWNNNDGDDTSAAVVAAALTPFYTHLVECWNGAAASDLQLCEFVRDDNDNDSNSVMDDDAHYTAAGDYEGAHCTLRRGMERVLQPLLADGVRERIWLNQPVTSITMSTTNDEDDDDEDDPAHPDDDDKTAGTRITLRTAAGYTVHAQACVVTVPVGCLQEALQRQQPDDAFFEPALTEEKREAIALTQMGTYKKVFLTFDRIFWPVDPPFLGLVRSVATTATTEKQDSNDKNDNPLGNYLLMDNLWAVDGIPSLEAILVGTAGTWATNQSDEDIQTAVLAFLSQAMGVTMEFLEESCRTCHVTRWEEDPYSRGAYSSTALGGLERHKEELRRPEWGGRLMLAGEATISEYEGSVHAAILSGKSVAEKASAAVKAAAAATTTTTTTEAVAA